MYEDHIWTKLVMEKGKLPPLKTALNFSIDSIPEYAIEMNNGKLPFGCHYWDSYYYSFWKKYINIH
jgi:hypothetical protein